MEDREKVSPREPEDVEAHKKHSPVALRGDEEPTPEGEGTDDDVELHRSKNQSKL